MTDQFKMGKIRDDDRARRTLYVTGFNPKKTTKPLLKELFCQGAPVADITLFETHAYILFKDEESVAYCLALFNEIELHGEKLRLNPRVRSKNSYCFMSYLKKVRDRLRQEYQKVTTPDLPLKKYSDRKNSSRGDKQIKNKLDDSNKSSPNKTKRGKRNKSKLKQKKVKSGKPSHERTKNSKTKSK